jgi:GH35 family endo-1,4-beta-xylanase
MRCHAFPPLLLLAVIGVAFHFAGKAVAAEPKPSDDELLAGADARIEKYRKADATVTVVDAAGQLVPGAKIEVAQTQHAFLFGSNIFVWGKVGDSKGEEGYRQRFAALLNYATLPFYWPMYEPKPGEPNHDYAKQVAAWCKEQGILTKGHPLAWNFADPRWLSDDPNEIHRLQMARIDDCVARFAGLIDRWDVVNEVTHYDRDEFLKRAPKQSAMWKKYGPIEFTRECFTHARGVNPKSTLLINDYRTDPPYEKVIEQLVDKDGKRLYDVIGIQSHMHGGPWPNTTIWRTCERFARFGVPLHFTEATILSGHRSWEKPKDAVAWDSTPEGEAYQAREVVRFYTMLFSHPAVEAITWWDFSDLHAWKNAPAGFIRKDMSPKPVYDELVKLIKGKWWTNASLTAGADGKASLRGILGNYKVTVTVPGRPAVVKEHSLKKGAKNEWQVSVP